jgi:hypothetical protein
VSPVQAIRPTCPRQSVLVLPERASSTATTRPSCSFPSSSSRELASSLVARPNHTSPSRVPPVTGGTRGGAASRRTGGEGDRRSILVAATPVCAWSHNSVVRAGVGLSGPRPRRDHGENLRERDLVSASRLVRDSPVRCGALDRLRCQRDTRPDAVSGKRRVRFALRPSPAGAATDRRSGRSSNRPAAGTRTRGTRRELGSRR